MQHQYRPNDFRFGKLLSSEIQNVELDIAKNVHRSGAWRNRISGQMSHELRTPLVIGFTRQMLKTQLTNKQTDYLQTIEKSANNLRRSLVTFWTSQTQKRANWRWKNIRLEFREVLEEVVNPTSHQRP